MSRYMYKFTYAHTHMYIHSHIFIHLLRCKGYESRYFHPFNGNIKKQVEINEFSCFYWRIGCGGLTCNSVHWKE